MPAIHLARLRKQVAALGEQFENPEVFVRDLHNLLEFYADRIQRPGQAGEPPPLISSYNVPKPLLRHIQSEIKPLADEKPQAALVLCDVLWSEPYFEFRILAAYLLGQIRPEAPNAIFDRVTHWSEDKLEDVLLGTLLAQSFSRMRGESPELLHGFIEDVINDEGINRQKTGLRTLLPLIEQTDLDYFPTYFRILGPHTRSAPTELRYEIVDVIRALAERSPQETSYFLQQNLEISEDQYTAWLIRQCLESFPVDIRNNLRQKLRSHN